MEQGACGKMSDAMRYTVELKPKAVKDLKGLPQADQRRMVEKLGLLATDIQGDVKKLTDFSPEYRLRVGTWRALFEVEGDKIIVYRILHRSKAY
jgi:mRNA interferase RelE/StbE